MVRFKVGRDQHHDSSIDRLLLQNRWILVELLPLPSPEKYSTTLNSKQIYTALKQSVIANFGDTGWGAIGSSLNGIMPACAYKDTNTTKAVKYYSPATNICMIRVARDPYRIVWGAITYLSSIDGQRYIPNVVHVSGQLPLSRPPPSNHSSDQGQSSTPSLLRSSITGKLSPVTERIRIIVVSPYLFSEAFSDVRGTHKALTRMI